MSRDKFLIRYINGQIEVFSVENELIPLKNEGETSFKYDSATFWKWFKRKIEYDVDEPRPLSFILEIYKDENAFKIPEDIIASIEKKYLKSVKIKMSRKAESGTIRNILVKKNDKVSQQTSVIELYDNNGQSALVQANIEGVIYEICVKKNEQVKAGDTLLKAYISYK